MPVWQYVAGWFVMIGAAVAIVLMIYLGCAVAVDETAKDTVKEVQEEADRQVQILAENRYQEMLRNTTFRVHIRTRIIDEMKKG